MQNEPQQYILLNSWIVERWRDELLYWDIDRFEVGDYNEWALEMGKGKGPTWRHLKYLIKELANFDDFSIKLKNRLLAIKWY